MVSNINENVNYTIKWGVKGGGQGKNSKQKKCRQKTQFLKRFYFDGGKNVFFFLFKSWLA